MSQETFERELTRRADTVHAAPLSFDDVRGKAVSIRRRRRAAVAGGVAAAVALVVIVPTILTGGDQPGSRAPEPAPPVPGHTAVLHDGTLTLPDGGTVALDVDNADVAQLGVLTDGRIVLAMNSRPQVRVYEPDGTLQEEYAVQSNAITMSAADDAVAWIGGEREGDRGVRVLASGVAEPTILPGIPAAGEYVGFVDAVLGPDRVLADGGYGTDTIITPDGAEDLRTSEPLRVTDVSPDGALWAVQYEDEADPQFGCVGLYDPDSATMIARNCETSGLRFSPDGQHVMGGYADNNMGGEISTYGLDLVEVGTFAPEGKAVVVASAAWDDSEHLLVSVADYESSRWSLVRVGLDGAVTETVVPEEAGDNPETVDEFLLSE